MNYWLRWTAVCGLGEFLGIGVAAGIGFGVVMTLGEPDTLGEKLFVILTAIVSGIIEGLVTGWLQWWVLREKFAAVKAKDWLFYTALGAATGWILGMTPSTFLMGQGGATPVPEFSSALIALLAAGAGLVLGALFGFFQWLELRKHTVQAARWIPANAIAWAIGLAIIYLGASMPTAETALAMVILIGTVSGLLAGLSVGAITGLFLIKLE
jgi:hypothetical protein